ncbi:hypothetical protein NMG60_11030097 [Bertholletia excelsa]
MGRSPSSDKSGLKKGPWEPHEDQKLMEYIYQNGHGNWKELPKRAGLNRCGKSCRLRWTNYLRPDIKRGNFSEEEELVIINLHSVLGNKWSKIATRLPGRTDNEIKNYWNTHLRKKLLKEGIDPRTHRPIPSPSFFPNLPHLLSPSNLANLISHDPLLKSSTDAIELAKIQLLQSIMQVLSTTPLPNIAGSSQGNPTEASKFAAVMELSTLARNSNQLLFSIPNNLVGDSEACFEGGYEQEFANMNCEGLTSCYGQNHQSEIALPALVSATAEGNTLEQFEINTSPNYPVMDSPSTTIFGDLEKFLEDEANGPWN